MDRAHWTSPSFRGRSPHQRHQTPRFRGDGNFGTPSRHFSPPWQQQRSPSPYRYQGQRGYGGSYSPHYHQSHHPHPYATSTPVHGSGGGGRRPFFRGGGGGGRFGKRQSFGQPPFGKGGSSDDIDNWISPEMWADPWRHLTGSTTTTTTTSSLSATQISNEKTGQEGTMFAESDFNLVTPSKNESCVRETQSEECVTTTKFADSDFIVTTDSSIGTALQQPDQDENTNKVGEQILANSVEKNDDMGDDDFEKFATDRVVLDSDQQLLS